VGRRGAQYLRQKLADPTFDKATSMMPNFGLTAEEIEAILAYMNTLNGSRP
jgi:cytochrome c1